MVRQPAPEGHPAFGFLRCNRCGIRTDCSEAEVIEYAKTDFWPMCCNEVMRFCASDEATTDLPALKRD